MQASRRKQLWAWALYDWGNSAFATTVMAGFFPFFFKQYWSLGADPAQSTLRLGAANSIASIIVAACAPVLGAIADRGSAKKRLLIVFTALGALMSGSLCFIPDGGWLTAAVAYAAATVGFAGSMVFYDSLLVSVATPDETDRASALGYALGYLGGGLLFGINVLMVLKPQLFGIADGAHGARYSFLTVALWWAVFTVPLVRYVREPSAHAVSPLLAIRGGLAQLAETLRRIRAMRTVWLFLLAYFLYIDGVDTVVRMAVDYGLSIGLGMSGLMTALLITQFVGFPAALVFGRLARAIGAKRGILLGVAVYIGVTVWGAMLNTAAEFYALAVIIGLVQGGVQALSRSFYSRLIPTGEAGEFFGFYNMLGKFAAIIGPALMGIVSWATGSARLSILSLAILFIGGGAILARVEEPTHAP